MIGLSLSFCVRDIIDGKVPEASVEKIVTSTMAFTKEDWEYVIASYRKAYWHKNPELGEAICWRLWAEDKLDQPRCRGEAHQNIRNGYWINEKGETVRF